MALIYNGRTTMKKRIVHIMLMGVALITLNACGTIEGVGKDLQRAGQAVEGEARKH